MGFFYKVIIAALGFKPLPASAAGEDHLELHDPFHSSMEASDTCLKRHADARQQTIASCHLTLSLKQNISGIELVFRQKGHNRQEPKRPTSYTEGFCPATYDLKQASTPLIMG